MLDDQNYENRNKFDGAGTLTRLILTPKCLKIQFLELIQKRFLV